MNRTSTLILISLIGLIAVSMWGNFGSFAAGGETKTQVRSTSQAQSEDVAAPTSQTPDEDTDVDPDFGKFGKNMDPETYLRKRDEFIARLRGVDFEHPERNDPTARGRAIRLMEAQETRILGQKLLSMVSSGFTPNSGGSAWTELGPNPIPNGQTQTSIFAVSGRVTAIEIDPTDSNKVYVGTAQGGVYRSTDGGATWTAIFDNAQSLAIGALALAPSNTNILYIGTGEANGSADCFAGVGLYRIDNAKTTAGALGDLQGPINPSITNGITYKAFNGRAISRILVLPTDPAVVFVGTAGGVIGIGGEPPLGNSIPPLGLRGLYRSSNATSAPDSVTFERVKVSVSNACFDTPCTGNRNINDMVFDPADATGNTLIVWQAGINTAGDGGIWRSTNARAVPASTVTFTQTFQTTATTTGTGRGALAIYPSTPQSVIYAASGESAATTLCGSSTQKGALRVSIDGGQTWSPILPGGGGFCGTQCGYNIGLDVRPGATAATTDDIVYVGGNTGSTNCQRIVGKSTDGGATAFARIDNGLHADTHVIKIDPNNPNVIYTGNDGGIFKSTDGGTTWASLNNSGFRATQFMSIALHPTDRNFSIGGTQDNGTNMLQPAASWNRIDFGDGGFALVDQNAADTSNVVMYHTYFNQANSLIGYVEADNVAGAHDGVWNFRGCGNGTTPANGITCADAVNFYAPLAQGPGNPNTVYYGTDRLYRSADKGVTNTVVSQNPVVPSVPISSIAISPQDDNYRLIGLNNGALFFTTNGSATLTSLDPVGAGGVIPDFYVGRVMFDPNDKNTAYVSLGGFANGTSAAQSHVWKVTNLASSPVLTSINGTGANILPDVPVNAFAIDPNNSNRLFAGTDIGVYNSSDGGVNWTPFGSGLPRVAVFGMAIQNPNRLLRIATHGRGMWEIPLGAPTTVQFSSSNYSVNEGAGSVTINVSRSGDTTGASTIDYRTTDNDTFTVNCGAKNGQAFGRCDFATVVGTLTFAAGETSKSFTVPIIDDGWAEGAETFGVALSNVTGATLGAQSTAIVTITDNETVDQPNPILQTNSTGVDFFVRQHYLDFLSREPEPGQPWSAILNGCGSQFNTDPNSPSAGCDRITVSGAFFGSPEFKTKGFYVIGMYRVALNRLPTYVEFAQDLASVAGTTAAETFAKRAGYANNFFQRTEVANIYGPMTNAPFVNALMSGAQGQNYNLTTIHTTDPANPDTGGKVTLTTTDLINGLTGATLTRAQVLRAIAQSDEITLQAEALNAFVASQYYGYLRRTPDTSGFNNWVNYLKANPNDFRTMVNGFVNSNEYRLRFGPVQ